VNLNQETCITTHSFCHESAAKNGDQQFLPDQYGINGDYTSDGKVAGIPMNTKGRITTGADSALMKAEM
jgi:hypothetical protein